MIFLTIPNTSRLLLLVRQIQMPLLPLCQHLVWRDLHLLLLILALPRLLVPSGLILHPLSQCDQCPSLQRIGGLRWMVSVMNKFEPWTTLLILHCMLPPVKILYTLDSHPNSTLVASLGRSTSVQVVSFGKKGPSKTSLLFGKVTLKTCLNAICMAR